MTWASVNQPYFHWGNVLYVLRLSAKYCLSRITLSLGVRAVSPSQQRTTDYSDECPHHSGVQFQRLKASQTSKFVRGNCSVSRQIFVRSHSHGCGTLESCATKANSQFVRALHCTTGLQLLLTDSLVLYNHAQP